uniref:Uncharacterized protein n=1 Tax=Caenorhabditis japonica TaxID=281687 RepID=A0A8R1DFC6_CAEJA
MQGIQFFGAFVAAALLIPDRYEYFYENDGYYSVGSDEIHAEWFYNFAAILEVFFVLCIVVNNVVTYTTFHWRFGKKSIAQKPNPGSQSQLSRERQKRESSLDRMTFIVCCVELVYFAYVVYSLQINPYMNRRVFYYFYNILCVIYSTFSAWMLLLVSQPITIEFRQLFT